MVLSLLTGRCYDAEICSAPIEIPFRWYHCLPKSIDFAKPWTRSTVRSFKQIHFAHNSEATELKFASHSAPIEMAFPMVSLLAETATGILSLHVQCTIYM